MRGIIHQGESESAFIVIRDGNGVAVNFNTFQKVEAFLMHSVTYKVLASYSLKPPSREWLEITPYNDIEGNQVGGVIRLSALETQGTPIGDIDIQVNIYLRDSEYSDKFITKIHKGKLAKMLRAKRK